MIIEPRFQLHSIALVVTAILLAAPMISATQASAPDSAEYNVKAAFLYNFIKFVDWPEDNIANKSATVTIGIVGQNMFGSRLDLLKNKPIVGKKLIVKQIDSFDALVRHNDGKNPLIRSDLGALKECQLVFISPTEKKHMSEIVNLLKEHPVLTVADTAGFLESGGMINMFVENKKVHFAINMAAAEQAGLKISSKLLQLAIIYDQKSNKGTRRL